MKKLIEEFAVKYLNKKEFKIPANLLPSDPPASAVAFLSGALFRNLEFNDPSNSGAIIVICPTNQEAEYLYRESLFFENYETVSFFPGFDVIPYEYAGNPAFLNHQRVQVLNKIIKKQNQIIFVSPEALLRPVVEPQRLKERIITLQIKQVIEPEALVRKLLENGYESTDRVEQRGEFCLKGGLVDLFPVTEEFPVRVEFFDDEIESLRRFNSETQIGGDKISICEILPACELILDETESDLIVKRLLSLKEFPAHLERPRWLETVASIENKPVLSENHYPGLQELFQLIFDGRSFWECFPKKPFVMLYNESSFRERVDNIIKEYNVIYEQESKNRITLPVERLLNLDVMSGIESYPNIFKIPESGFDSNKTPKGIADDIAQGLPSGISGEIKRADIFRGRISETRDAIYDLIKGGGTVCITSPYPSQLRRIESLFRAEKNIQIRISENLNIPDNLAKKDTLWLCRSDIREGWSIPRLQFYLWTDIDLFGRSYKKRSRFKKASSVPLDSFVDLKINDFVVHVNHGIGKFVKIERVKAAGRERDFIVLEYADEDRLFVPLDQISLIQKYIAPVEEPKLDNLGKSSFKKIKERVEKRVESLAQDLIKIYALRMSQKGYAYPHDTAWQEEFEADFPYEETTDQLTAIEAVKNDMESEQPMDRLICGDVGYGKTEVAIRACFKAVMAGKQVVLIAPTTVLALQHFNTFRERFKNYPVSVDMLSRFRSKKELADVKKNLAAGTVDVVIGTHSIIAGDIRFKNLGLLVVDEEQRFGVSHKEAIKDMKKMVDVITLSATPIPRTLHMSLVGIRDLSIIQTPPRDRLPVQTYVMEDSDVIMKDAITRELERGGQVFFLHNRVETIEPTMIRLQNFVPEARYAILHGQLPEDEIEEILIDFLEHKYDVLITTSIIESGIDMPNVNTLIVDRAYMFGLSQLYQIRGRVGRSSVQAYAYLFYPKGVPLTEKASKRLNTIHEYQELGSGFKVAMRDLEIRGAGNVLGKEQSGDIMDVGFELYVKLLDDAVKRLKGEKTEAEIRCLLNLRSDYYLSEEYIQDTRQRIEFYKRFESSIEPGEVDRLKQELQDRFGNLPDAARRFVNMEKIRTLARIAGFELVQEEENGEFRMRTGEYFRVPVEHILLLVRKIPELYILPGSKNTLFYRVKLGAEDSLADLIQILLKICEPLMSEKETI